MHRHKGAMADVWAGTVCVPSDYTRDEDASEIAYQNVAGMKNATQVELDRAVAILDTIWRARPADVVLLAGKGHETYQEVKGKRSPFDDREWGRFALTWRGQHAIVTDTRSLEADQVFLALSGERFDGHEI